MNMIILLLIINSNSNGTELPSQEFLDAYLAEAQILSQDHTTSRTHAVSQAKASSIPKTHVSSINSYKNNDGWEQVDINSLEDVTPEEKYLARLSHNTTANAQTFRYSKIDKIEIVRKFKSIYKNQSGKKPGKIHSSIVKFLKQCKYSIESQNKKSIISFFENQTYHNGKRKFTKEDLEHITNSVILLQNLILNQKTELNNISSTKGKKIALLSKNATINSTRSDLVPVPSAIQAVNTSNFVSTAGYNYYASENTNEVSDMGQMWAIDDPLPAFNPSLPNNHRHNRESNLNVAHSLDSDDEKIMEVTNTIGLDITENPIEAFANGNMEIINYNRTKIPVHKQNQLLSNFVRDFIGVTSR